MATKSSIQEERIHTVSAPGADPGAAYMTIPRRDLLTGTALFLVGSATACAGSASGGKQKLLRTQFMADFTAAFIGDPTKIKDPGQADPWPGGPSPSRLWPRPGQTGVDIVNEYATFVKVLMTMGYVMGSAPAAAPGSLGEKIAQFLVAQKWPATAAVPPEYEGELPTVRLVEISVIFDRLLQAMNSFGVGPGGGGSNWPPH